MSGILLIGVLIVWIGIAVVLARAFTQRIEGGAKRTVVGFLVLALLLPLPLVDEIVGGFQFRALCRNGAVMKIDVSRAKNATLKFKTVPDEQTGKYMVVPSRKVPGTWLPIIESDYQLFTATWSAPVISYRTYDVGGGHFIRMLGISQGNAPLIINRSHCAPPQNLAETLKSLGAKTVN